MTPPIVIIGAGQTGGWAARTLRQSGYEGRLLLIGDEPHPPYERPPLSKGLLTGSVTPEQTYLFEGADWDALDVAFARGVRAVRINRQDRTIHLSDGDQVQFQKLLMATGSRPRAIRVPGGNLPGVYYLRTLSDSLTLSAQMRSQGRLLIVGAGWIGLEVAAAARKLGQEVIVVEAGTQICSRAIDRVLSSYLASVHRSHGVDLRFGTSVLSFRGAGRIEAAQLTDGTEVEIIGAVVGIGAVPNSELAAEAGLAIENGIKVDEFGQTSDPDIYAAGDVASYPDSILGRRVRLESWENAQNHGIHTAKSMLGRTDGPYAQVPWFWSDQYDLNIQLVGLPSEWDRTVVRGTQESDSFCICYMKDGLLQAAAGVNRAREIRILRRLILTRRAVDPDLLTNDAVRLDSLLQANR